MCAHSDSTRSGLADGLLCHFEGMPPVDALQRTVIRTLYPIFYDEERALVQFLQIIEQGIRHTIGTRTDDQAHHIGHGQGFLVLSLQFLQLGIRIGIGLEISQELHVGVLAGKEELTLLQLFGHTLFRLAISRIEGLVVAIRTSAIAHRTVTIRTGETGIQGNLLYLVREMCRQVSRKVVVS